MKRFALAVDIGGTFTDFVLIDRQLKLIHSEKVLTNPRRPELAILTGVDQLAARCELNIAQADLFLHATTIITNALIERKGCDFVTIFTAGFGDALEIAKETRYDLTDLKLKFPDPVSRRDLRIEVDERMSAAGEPLRAPNKERFLSQLTDVLRRHPTRSFAVCLLHSYANPDHERKLADWIRAAVPGAYISGSAQVTPTQREYERWTSCTVNAYTMPLLADYVRRLELALHERGFPGRALMMTSSGVPAEFDRCIQFPIRLIESGPAAGVLAAQQIGVRNDMGASGASPAHNLLAYDMGGTTAKGAFLTGGELKIQGSLEVARVGNLKPGSGLVLMIPAIDLIETGVGGGSIAHIDERGVLTVGPHSAGALPGPACYAMGGKSATVTDANVALGLLGVENFRNSGINASADLARQAIETPLASALQLSVERVAHGIRETVNEDVARAFRVHASEAGIDYRTFTLVCTGGSAPLHAAEIARLLSIRHVIFPFGAGVCSAFGLLSAREGSTVNKNKTMTLGSLTKERVQREMLSLVGADKPQGNQDLGPDVTFVLGLRYVGQGHHLDISFSANEELSPSVVRASFEREYMTVFGTIFSESDIEIVSWAYRSLMRDNVINLAGLRYAMANSNGPKLKGHRMVHIEPHGEAVKVPIYDRYCLRAGDLLPGGSLVEEKDTTIYLPAFVQARVTESLDILAEIETRS